MSDLDGAPADAPAPPDVSAPGRPAWAIVGALVFAVIGIALVVPAVHVATEPILLPTANGPAFDCGTALRPPTAAFPKNVCGAEPQRNQQEAAAWLVAAVIVGVGGALAFLVPTRHGAGHPAQGRRRRTSSRESETR
jgi:hypothetical protein